MDLMRFHGMLPEIGTDADGRGSAVGCVAAVVVDVNCPLVFHKKGGWRFRNGSGLS